MMLLGRLSYLAPLWISRPTHLVLTPGTELLGPNLFFARFTSQLSAGLFLAFITLFLLLLFVVLLRREWLAIVTLWLLMTLLTTLVSQGSLMMVPFTALSAFLSLAALKRYGWLALSSALFFSHLGIFYPITTELSAWYATDFTIALAICVALAAYGFYTSLGGQKLVSGDLLDD